MPYSICAPLSEFGAGCENAVLKIACERQISSLPVALNVLTVSLLSHHTLKLAQNMIHTMRRTRLVTADQRSSVVALNVAVKKRSHKSSKKNMR